MVGASLLVLAGFVITTLASNFGAGNVIAYGSQDSGITWVIPMVVTVAAVVLWWLRPSQALRLVPIVGGIALIPAAVVQIGPGSLLGWSSGLLTTASVLVTSGTVLLSLAMVFHAAALVRAGDRRWGIGAFGLWLLQTTVVLRFALFGWRDLSEAVLTVVAVVFLCGAVMAVVGGFLSRVRWERVDTRTGAAVAAVTVVSLIPTVWLQIAKPSFQGVPTAYLVVLAVSGALCALLAIIVFPRLALVILTLAVALGSFQLVAGVGANTLEDLGAGFAVLFVLGALIGCAVAGLNRARQIAISALGIAALALLTSYLLVEVAHVDEDVFVALAALALVSALVALPAMLGAALPPRPQKMAATVGAEDADGEAVVVLATVPAAVAAGLTAVVSLAVPSDTHTADVAVLWGGIGVVITVVLLAFWPRRATLPGAPTGPGQWSTASGQLGPGVVPSTGEAQWGAVPATGESTDRQY